MPTAQLFDTQGKEAGNVELPDKVFGIKPHRAVLHEALLAQLASRRSGTHSTKTRGEVAGSTRKIHGSIKAPIFVGGGITFGPKPRDYSQHTPKKVRRLALRSALSAKAAAGRIVVIEAPSLGDAPKTRAVAELLDRLPVEGQTLIVTAGVDTALLRATGNLAGVKVAPAQRLTVHDLLTAEFILLTRPAVDAVTEVLGND
ncbi:MAG: 50S ribosomal protein L4 [Armatimonadetes bacterium]|nr:50S ribosomal protein L4 [Armatimonadota bacterium]